MIYGTHNSATGGRLVWWLRPLAWVINPTSKCQSRTIKQQLEDGVKLFNLQIAYDGERWYFSHGLALYKEDVIETIAMMRACATAKEPIYFQLYLDKSYWHKQDVYMFSRLVADLRAEWCDKSFVMLCAWVEGCNNYPYRRKEQLNAEEHYWTAAWAKVNAKSWLDKLPLPRRHAKRWNATYRVNCKSEYLMLDYYELG